ncbi:MAG: ATPase domain-containing protein [Candidatus Obscuribacterales bacterium]
MKHSDYKCISTGNPQMDEILNGGFPSNSINIIMGQPGTGKTIFAEQMVFHHARDNDKDERPILYVTTLSEPAAKVLMYLQRFSFFDESKVGSVVHYQEIGTQLTKNGIGAMVPFIEDAIHSLSPKIIVIDSFKALHDLAESTQQMRRMLYELTGLLTAFETTVFLLGEYTDEHAQTLPEFAIADGILQFLRSSLSTRDERFLRVLKLRGSSYLEGLHGCKITSAGLDIFPRLVTPSVAESYYAEIERVSSGVAGFDEVVGGGFLRGSTTVVAGPAGAGKTTFGLQFALAGSRQNERSLYVNFQENPSQLARLIKFLGADLDKIKLEGFELLYASPVELQIDSIIVKLFGLIQEKNIKRVVIDSISDFSRASSDADRLHDYLYSLLQHLSLKGVTTLLTYETVGTMLDDGKDAATISRFSNMSDNIVLLGLGHEPEYERDIRCIKARATKHDRKAHRFEITDKGICVY